ncbi:MAG: LPS export ABC transporter periplasmic protein LptC [Fibrobacter sp.]|nr:LPS export ABC transporter periplasmic protein LptC [Fibrobacter sp.]
MKIVNRVFFLSIIMAIAFFQTGCNNRKEALPVSGEDINSPVQEFINSTLYFYSKKYLQWKLESEQMRKSLSDTGSIMVTPVKLTLYDSIGQIRTRVFADSGIIGNKMQSYIVWGDVLIRTDDSKTIRSQKLRWFKDRRKVESDTYVQIETNEGDILRGKGLDAVDDFSRFSFKSDVSGKFPDFKRRLENEDESIF